MSKANYALRLQPSLKKAAERPASVEGTSLNQFINVAVVESFRLLRRKHSPGPGGAGDCRAFLEFLDEAGDEPLREGDVFLPNRAGPK